MSPRGRILISLIPILVLVGVLSLDIAIFGADSILCAMCFGACMRESGMIGELSRLMLPLTRTRGGLVGSTVVTGTLLNGIVSDQYLSILLTSHIYRKRYEEEGYVKTAF